jgi:hypothetical protein
VVFLAVGFVLISMNDAVGSGHAAGNVSRFAGVTGPRKGVLMRPLIGRDECTTTMGAVNRVGSVVAIFCTFWGESQANLLLFAASAKRGL